MNIPIQIICIFLTAVVGLQAWTLKEVVTLKAEMAALKASMAARRRATADQTEI